MSFLNRLWVTGEMGNERNFKVELKGGESLDRLVDLATSKGNGTILLAEAQLPEPVARIQVYLGQVTASTTGHVPYIIGHGRYVLKANLVPHARQRLHLNPKDFSGFEVRRYDKAFFLNSHLLPNLSPIMVKVGWPGNENGIDLSHSVQYGRAYTLIQEEVKDAMTAFAEALETTVNSVYSSARKPSPETTLELGVVSLF